MITQHRIYFKNAHRMADITTDAVDLVVTSPPYPMIEMWDSVSASQNAEIDHALQNEDGLEAFELIH